ncbi:MAG: OmpA family protein, partial [Planctomycetota bacterium]
MSVARRFSFVFAVITLLALLAGCAAFQQERTERTTSRDKTKKGAAKILAGAAIGAGVGAGVGAYMDRQEEKLARIPGTTVERVGDNMLLVHFDSDVLFSIDSALLNEDSRYALDQAADVFMDYPKTAIIAQGHTDSSGNESYNQQLSERRARSVVGHLVTRG